FQPELAERKARSTNGFAGHATSLLLSVLNLLWHQHDNLSPKKRARFFARAKSNLSSVSISIRSSTTTRPRATRLRSGTRSICYYRGNALSLPHYVASINPNLNANRTERRSCFGKSVINVCSKSVKRQSTVQIPFRTRDFSAVQSTGNSHFNSKRPEPLGVFHRFAHCASKRDSLFQLQRDLFCLELRIQFRLVNLLDINQNFAPGFAFDLIAELVDFRTLSTDDDSRS